jgi:hypothetical protein
MGPPMGSIVAWMSRSVVPRAKLLPITTYGPARPRIEISDSFALWGWDGLGKVRSKRAPWTSLRFTLEAEVVRMPGYSQVSLSLNFGSFHPVLLLLGSSSCRPAIGEAGGRFDLDSGLVRRWPAPESHYASFLVLRSDQCPYRRWEEVSAYLSERTHPARVAAVLAPWWLSVKSRLESVPD